MEETLCQLGTGALGPGDWGLGTRDWGLGTGDWGLGAHSATAGKMKLEFLENPRSSLLGFSRISNSFQTHFLDFLEIACCYWPDLARIQATKLGLSRISIA